MMMLVDRPGQERGFSLIELMVAMTISLFLLVSIISVYLSSKQTYRTEEALSRLQDNARYAMELLAEDIRMAGYTGCYSGTMPIVNTLNLNTTYAYNFAVGLWGYHATASAWNPPLDPSLTAPANPNPPLVGTDVITLRRSEDGLFLIPPYMTSNTANLQVAPGNTFQQGDIVLVNDCGGAAIFQITNPTPSATGTLSHNQGVGTPGNSTNDLGKKFGQEAEIARVYTISYYIAPSSFAGNAVSSLWRREGANAPAEVAEGIQDMQILYGEDTDNDRTANRYVTADVADMGKVVSIKISLLLRTLDEIADRPTPYTFNGNVVNPTDRRLSRVFSTVINLRNKSF